jgi:hypothetical protein
MASDLNQAEGRIVVVVLAVRRAPETVSTNFVGLGQSIWLTL